MGVSKGKIYDILVLKRSQYFLWFIQLIQAVYQ